jgi:hypothetical protein
MASADDTLPCPASVPPQSTDAARDERAEVAYNAYRDTRTLLQGPMYEPSSWADLPPYEREAWRAAADAAYNHVIVSPT